MKGKNRHSFFSQAGYDGIQELRMKNSKPFETSAQDLAMVENQMINEGSTKNCNGKQNLTKLGTFSYSHQAEQKSFGSSRTSGNLRSEKKVGTGPLIKAQSYGYMAGYRDNFDYENVEDTYKLNLFTAKRVSANKEKEINQTKEDLYTIQIGDKKTDHAIRQCKDPLDINSDPNYNLHSQIYSDYSMHLIPIKESDQDLIDIGEQAPFKQKPNINDDKLENSERKSTLRVSEPESIIEKTPKLSILYPPEQKSYKGRTQSTVVPIPISDYNPGRNTSYIAPALSKNFVTVNKANLHKTSNSSFINKNYSPLNFTSARFTPKSSDMNKRNIKLSARNSLKLCSSH